MSFRDKMSEGEESTFERSSAGWDKRDLKSTMFGADFPLQSDKPQLTKSRIHGAFTSRSYVFSVAHEAFCF
jgi:hypothetical protein